jgi:RhtB (resistance to homoserine/threonine) family protein
MEQLSRLLAQRKSRRLLVTFLANWLTVFIIGCLAVISPGPNLAITLRNGLVYSRKAGVYTAVGLATGNLVHATYCLLGIGVIISKSIFLFNILKWLGAAYLLYIGIKSLQVKKAIGNVTNLQYRQTISNWTAFRTGLFTNLLNPKVTLFFLALFTQIIRPATPLLIQAVYGLTIVSIEFAWFALVAILISQHTLKNFFLSFSHWIERATGVTLIALGLRLVFTKENNT